jgi:hypothetical protein
LASSPNISGNLQTFYYCFADLQNQPGAYSLDNQHFPRDASNHDNLEEAAAHPHEDLSNGPYLGQQAIYSDQTEVQVENKTEGMETQMNTCMSFSSWNMHFTLIFHEGNII